MIDRRPSLRSISGTAARTVGLVPYRVLAVGATAGAVESALSLIGSLPSDFPLPVALSCERDPDGSDLLLRRLQSAARLPVVEPDDKDDLEPGRVYLAPAGYHLIIERESVALSRDPDPAPPSPAPLFESAADSYGSATAAVLLGTTDSAEIERALHMVRDRGGLTLRAVAADRIPALVEELFSQPGRKAEHGR